MGEGESPKWAYTFEGWNRPRAIPSAQANRRPLSCKFVSIAMGRAVLATVTFKVSTSVLG